MRILKSGCQYLLIIALLISCNERRSSDLVNGSSLLTPFEKGNGNQSATYDETIEFYLELEKRSNKVKVLTQGFTDTGKPLHLVMISSSGNFDLGTGSNKNKVVILINNGIHAGEPCGIDASMVLARDLALGESDNLLEKTLVAIIPVYNIGGMLNRGCCTRANQNGPKEQGFRANSRNLDLNRDFIKCDSENARSFAKIFHQLKPHVFVDTHTSDGADYQYTMTLIATQKDKLNPLMSRYMEEELLPRLYSDMEERGTEMVPYVNMRYWSYPPDSGIVGFPDFPRYSSGYTSLFNTISFITETHMFKPFKNRVEATGNFLFSLLEHVNDDAEKIVSIKADADSVTAKQKRFHLKWELDTAKYEYINFKGFEASLRPGEVTGIPRLHYNRKLPYEKNIKYYNSYFPVISVEKPGAYVIPQAWGEVIERLKINEVNLHRLKRDTTLEVEVYYLDNVQTSKRLYEGHYPNTNVEIRKEIQMLPYHSGDYLVIPDQISNRYIIETLEPHGADSWFAWNFFDAVMNQKEYFSPYVFEDMALDILNRNEVLRSQFEKRKAEEPEFAANAYKQLEFIYRNSDYYERTHNRYPVARLIQSRVIDLIN